LTRELTKIETPCQVIWGDKDGLLNPESFPDMVAALPHAFGHLIAGRGHQPHLGNPERVTRLVADFMRVNMMPDEEILEAAPLEGEKLTLQETLFEKYQTWFKKSRLPEVDLAELDVPLTPPERLSRAEMKAILMERSESLVDQLLDWEGESPRMTFNEIEDAALELRRQLGLDVTGLLLEETAHNGSISDDGAEPTCPKCGEGMQYAGDRPYSLETRLGTVDLKRGFYACPACGKEAPLGWD